MFLTIEDVLKALNATASSRVFQEGEQVLNANHVISCSATKKGPKFVEIFALCLQSSRLSSEPHEITGEIKWNGCKKFTSNFICSCVAGKAAKCKHISAVLLYTTRCDVTQLPIVSQTEKSCSWNALKGPSLEKYKPLPIMETPCFKDKAVTTHLTSDIRGDFVFKKLIGMSETSALTKHKCGRRTFSGESTQSTKLCANTNITFIEDFFRNNESDIMMELCNYHVNFQKECCVNTYFNKFDRNPENICKLTIEDHNLWHQERKWRITGSRCYPIYTYSQDQWLNKTLKYFWPKNVTTSAMYHGQLYESKARKKYMEVCGMEVIQMGLIISKLNPWLGYSPDGVVLRDGKLEKLLEIKCVEIGKTETALITNENFIKKCQFLQNKESHVTLKKKHTYYGQIQMGMAMLNVDSTDFIIYSSFDDTFININVKFDYDFCKEMLFKIKANYFGKMLHVICEYDK